MEDGRRCGPLTERCAHRCADIRNLLAERPDWHTPWLTRVLPPVERIAEAFPERAFFPRLIPTAAPEEEGTWRRCHERWSGMTRGGAPPQHATAPVPSLARLVPPGRVLDKRRHAPRMQPEPDAMPRGVGRTRW